MKLHLMFSLLFIITFTFSQTEKRISKADSSRNNKLDNAIEESFNENINLDVFDYSSKSNNKDTIIETDLSIVKIENNSVYMIITKTYKTKDSVLYSARYQKDTSIISREGWERKNGISIGKWTENTSDGIWIYTINYDNGTWIYNEKVYPHFKILDLMKLKADSLIIDKFGKDFFDKNVKYQFYGNLSKVTYEKKDSLVIEKSEWLGSWREPIKEIPNKFELDYYIKLDKDDIYDEGCTLEIKLDSLGNLIDEKNEFYIGFNELKNNENEIFSLTYDKALKICSQNGLDTSKDFQSEMKYISSRTEPLVGEFLFEIKQEISKETKGNYSEYCTIETKYCIWRINPWTSELIDKKKYLQIDYFNKGYGGSYGKKEIE